MGVARRGVTPAEAMAVGIGAGFEAPLAFVAGAHAAGRWRNASWFFSVPKGWLDQHAECRKPANGRKGPAQERRLPAQEAQGASCPRKR